MACLLDQGQPTELTEILTQDFQKQKCEPLHIYNALVLIYYILFCLKYSPPPMPHMSLWTSWSSLLGMAEA